MQVISKSDTNNWSVHHDCENCDSELKINIQDIRYKLVKAYSYEDNDYKVYSVYCPVCNQNSNVPQSLIPKLIQILIKQI